MSGRRLRRRFTVLIKLNCDRHVYQRDVVADVRASSMQMRYRATMAALGRF
ncbi:hypothetical protein [Myceligenerans salitolerans]|uniref:Uncharacterized protein n=1 Tax=Myceligenerans salitolerans TaxID=1230528 RepID=A0ABS3ICL4_9MICO|nr:hypothetical protein [Myceligenerans salitolerans]MBO0610710.1 hypothetical protein [Myceligenerans salitolerans]